MQYCAGLSRVQFCDPKDYRQPGSSANGDSPGKNTGVPYHALLQGIFPVKYNMWNTGLDEAQAGIKIARRNINNLRYADVTTLMEESVGSFLMRVKEERGKKLA